MTDLENAVKKLTDVLHAAAKKSGEIFENTKISYNISTERDKIAKLQNKIGAKFYKIYKEGGAVPESIVEDLEAISAIEETIRALEKTLADSKPYKFCSECGARLELNDIYCAKCGAKQHDVEQKQDEACDCEDGQDEACDCEGENNESCCDESKEGDE